MGAMENLYKMCTFLGTVIFILLFLNYYLEAKDEVYDADTNETVEVDKKSKAKSKKPRKTQQ